MKRLLLGLRVLMFALITVLPALAQADDGTCWKDSYGRGFAQVPHCAAGEENSGGLCYPTCKTGYVGVGAVCWQACPSGWQDIGVSCAKPGNATRPPFLMEQVSSAAYIGRSSGTDCRSTWPRGYLNTGNGKLRQGYDPVPRSGPQALQSGEMAVNLGAPFFDPRNGGECWICPSAYSRSAAAVTADNACYVPGGTNNQLCNAWSKANGGPGSCEQIGALLYPLPPPGYHCTLDTCTVSCPGGYRDDGLYCAKTQNYARSVSKLAQTCQPGYSYDGGLCYPSCRAGFAGVGPVCWATCAADSKYPVECGGACAQDTPSCAVDITDQVLATLALLANVADTAASGGATASLGAAKKALEKAVSDGVKSFVKEMVGKVTKDAVKKKVQEIALTTGTTLATSTPDLVGDLLTNQDYEFDWTVFDPTGIASVVMAYKRPLCSAVQGTVAPSGGWTKMPGNATQVAVGKNGAIWAVGVDAQAGGYSIYRMVNGQWQKVPGAGVRIAVDPDGNAWVVNSNHEIFRWTGSQFVRMSGAATDIAIGANGAVWVLGTQATNGGYAPNYWNGSSWAVIAGGGVRIAVQDNGNPAVVNNRGEIYGYDGKQWSQLSGQASAIGIAGKMVYVLGTTRQTGGHPIYYWNGSGWNPLPGALEQIAVMPDGRPIGTDVSNQIYQFR